MVLGNRKIGLGVMGFADLLSQLPDSLCLGRSGGYAERIMKFIQLQDPWNRNGWLMSGNFS